MNIARTLIILFAMILVAGCIAKITVDKRPNFALPIYHDSSKNSVKEYVIVDQGYKVRYFKFGFNTDIQSMSAEITTNKTVKFELGGLHSTSPTNSISIRLEDLLKIVSLFREVDGNLVLTNVSSIIDIPIDRR